MKKKMITISTIDDHSASFRSDYVTAFREYHEDGKTGVLISISTGESFRTTQYDHDGLFDAIVN